MKQGHDEYSFPARRRTWPARVVASLCGAFAATVFWPCAVSAATFAAVYRDAKPSVVYIACVMQDDVSSGSGFIYASNATTSTVITANHVVEGALKIDVILDGDVTQRYAATVVKRDHVRDVAELSISVGGRTGLKLDETADIKEGMGVAAIGYPRAAKKFEKSLGDGLRPSVHAGIVSAIRLGGEVLQYDATTDHGDSGGPLIDTASGGVVGIVRGTLIDRSYLSDGYETLPGSNLAMSAASIAAVLAGAPLAASKIGSASGGVASFFATLPLTTSQRPSKATQRAASSSTSASIASRNGPAQVSSSAAYRVGFAAPHSDDPDSDSVDGPLVTRLMQHYKVTDELYVVPATPGIAEEAGSKLSGYCDDNRLDAIVEPLVRRGPLRAAAGAANRKVDVSLDLSVMDCSGEPFFSARKTAQGVALASGSHDLEVMDTFGAMLDALIVQFDAFKNAHAGAWKALLTTGLALDPADERYHSLIGITFDKASNQFRITTVYVGGPGYMAGVQVGDKVVAVDGKPVKGLTLDALLARLNGSKYALSVVRPGGPVIVSVSPQKRAALEASLQR